MPNYEEAFAAVSVLNGTQLDNRTIQVIFFKHFKFYSIFNYRFRSKHNFQSYCDV